MRYFDEWIIRCHREAPDTCVVTSWRGATPDTASITVTGGRGYFMMGADFSWRFTDRLEGESHAGELATVNDAWARFMAAEGGL